MFNRDSQRKQNAKKLKQLQDLVKKKQFDTALKCANEYIAAVPNNPDALFIIAGIYYMKNNLTNTLKYVNRALDIATYDIDMLLLKAYVHQELKQDKIALKCCLKIQEIDPDNYEASRIRSELNF